jgi:hypothetical protein
MIVNNSSRSSGAGVIARHAEFLKWKLLRRWGIGQLVVPVQRSTGNPPYSIPRIRDSPTEDLSDAISAARPDSPPWNSPEGPRGHNATSRAHYGLQSARTVKTLVAVPIPADALAPTRRQSYGRRVDTTFEIRINDIHRLQWRGHHIRCGATGRHPTSSPCFGGRTGCA